MLKRDGSGVTTLAVVGLRALANEASGHRGRASPSGRAGDHRRQAPSNVFLTGHAPNVPLASVGSGHPRTTTVSANALRAVGSAGTERSKGASQARSSRGRGSPFACSADGSIVFNRRVRTPAGGNRNGALSNDLHRFGAPSKPFLQQPAEASCNDNAEPYRNQHYTA